MAQEAYPRIGHIGDGAPSRRQSGWRLVAKGALDRVTGVIGLIIGAPIMVAVAASILYADGSPVLYRQNRPGKAGRPFKVIKFRTMRVEQCAGGKALPDADRMTRLGRFLRATSLDELPQLWNVVRGDLSLVGPRPLLMQYLARYSVEQARRHEVLPGITGWAQVNGRNAISWEQKFELDVWYVDHWSLGLDLRILWLTVVRVVQRSGISREGHATMPEFMGTERRK